MREDLLRINAVSEDRFRVNSDQTETSLYRDTKKGCQISFGQQGATPSRRARMLRVLAAMMTDKWEDAQRGGFRCLIAALVCSLGSLSFTEAARGAGAELWVVVKKVTYGSLLPQ